MLPWLYVILVCYTPLIDSIVPRTSFGPGVPDLSFSRIVSYIIILAFALHCCIKSSIKINLRWLGLLLLFSTIEIASLSWSNLRINSFILQEFFNIIIVPFCMAVVAMNVLDDQSNTKKFIRHILIAGSMLGAISMFQMSKSFLAGMQAIRTTGTFENPNALAIFLVLIIPAALWGIETGTISKKAGLASLAAILLGILCTVSRKGLFTAALSIFIYLWIKKRHKHMALFAVLVVVIAVVSTGIGSIAQRFETEAMGAQVDTKWNMTVSGWKMFKDSPLIGLGYSGYYENFGRYMPNAHKDNFDAHNIFITVLANYGLLGFLPFLGIFLYPLVISMKILKRINPVHPLAYLRENATFCIAVVIPFMINGWFAGGMLHNISSLSLLYTNIAMMVGVKLSRSEIQKLSR